MNEEPSMRVNVHNELSKLDLEERVGKHLGSDFFSLDHSWSVGEAIAHIRSLPYEVKLRYFYVVDGKNKLKGVVSSHQLIVSDDATPLQELMDSSPLSISVDSKLKEAIALLNEHRLVGLPVVDGENTLKGIIEMEVKRENFTSKGKSNLQVKKALYNDIFQLIGLSIDESEKKSAFRGFITRMPWLFGNLVAGLTCAAIASAYNLVLKEAIILAMFIPLVLTLSESIAMQSMAMSLNMLHGKAISASVVLKKIATECKTAVLLGLTAALVVEIIAFFFHKSELPLFVVASSIFISMICTASIGVLIPVLLHLARLDPRVAGGPVVLMFADILATTIYLSLATWWIL